MGKLKARDWNFGTDTGPTKSYFDLAELKQFIDAGGLRFFKKIRFSDCDFQGISSNESQVVFDKCEFLNCDLSLSTFKNFKFSKCTFRGSSFGQTTFRDVEFRDCIWEKMAVSTNETVLEDVFISNPSDFNKSLWTQLDEKILTTKNASKMYQWHRHELAKSTIARMLLNNHRYLGDDRTFYESVRVFETQQAYDKCCRATYNTINRFRWASAWYAAVAIFWSIELGLLWTFGILNAWGGQRTPPINCLDDVIHGRKPVLFQRKNYLTAPPSQL
ncbi:pentapeptide repeat-containing protein [Brevundimonas sp.]|uniref:pentapeptide repeat-containing protein n=1 Tax=Brevundimonas sp. TaxID=1871086 RepID=UPI00289A9D5B|nr:pentapeptide repeat-containing protein [Brevundimonas sp.]